MFGQLSLSGPRLCAGLEGDEGNRGWMDEPCKPRLPAGDKLSSEVELS